MTIEAYFDRLEEYGSIGTGQEHKVIEFCIGVCELIWHQISIEGKDSINVALEFINGVSQEEDLLASRVELWKQHDKIPATNEAARSTIRTVLCCMYCPKTDEQRDSLVNVIEFCRLADASIKDEEFLKVAKDVYLV